MIITNEFGLPETFVNIMKRPTYSKGGANLSVTEMINSPQIVQLRKTHDEEITIDVSDNVFSMFGSAMHLLLEHGKSPNHILEERLHSEVDGWSISGAIDLQVIEEDGIVINDYKKVGVWATMNEKPEWEQQLNIYAWLVEKVKKTPVKKVAIVAIIKDFNKRESKIKEGYPKAQIITIDIPLWPYEERENFIKARIRLHSDAYMAAQMGEDLPICTSVEMWEKETTFAVKKVGNKRATVVCASQEQADQKVTELGKGYEIEIRKGERTRCADYCLVNKFCNQYQQYLKSQEE